MSTAGESVRAEQGNAGPMPTVRTTQNPADDDDRLADDDRRNDPGSLTSTRAGDLPTLSNTQENPNINQGNGMAVPDHGQDRRVPLDQRNLFPEVIVLPGREITAPRIFKYFVLTLTVIGLLGVCAYMQREFYLRHLMKYAPSPSPFRYEQAHSTMQPQREEEEPESEVISIKYQPPSDVLQKIPFLKKSEDEIYSDQMKQVMWSLREAVKRMDGGGNETQLAGVITMRPNDKPVNEINVRGDDPVLGEDTSDPKLEPSNAVKDLVKRLTSALTEITGEKDLLPDEEDEDDDFLDSEVVLSNDDGESDPLVDDPIAKILNYREKYFQRDQELAQMLADPANDRNPKLLDEADKRDEIRRRLISKLIDHFFATETDDEARIERAYHYAMSDADKYERQVRLEAEIFGPADLDGGRDVVFQSYRQQMGYVYDESLKTYINGSEVQKLKKLDPYQRKGFYSEMRILLKLEKRIKAKVVKYAKERQIPRSEL